MSMDRFGNAVAGIGQRQRFDLSDPQPLVVDHTARCGPHVSGVARRHGVWGVVHSVVASWVYFRLIERPALRFFQSRLNVQ